MIMSVTRHVEMQKLNEQPSFRPKSHLTCVAADGLRPGKRSALSQP